MPYPFFLYSSYKLCFLLRQLSIILLTTKFFYFLLPINYFVNYQTIQFFISSTTNYLVNYLIYYLVNYQFLMDSNKDPIDFNALKRPRTRSTTKSLSKSSKSLSKSSTEQTEQTERSGIK